MAKSSKLEDYWKEKNVESLLKDLTRTLVQRMPTDPVVAIVEHLQRKFPKSFKKPIDDIQSSTTAARTLANQSQSQSLASPRSDVDADSTKSLPAHGPEPSANQADGRDHITFPDSTLTDRLNQDTINTNREPELNLRSLVFANRLGQYAFKLGKDVQSHSDILQEELIKPMLPNEKPSTIGTAATLTGSDHAHTPGEPSVLQLVKYKQHIHSANSRRLHREELARLAGEEHEKVAFLHVGLATKPDEAESGEKIFSSKTSSLGGEPGTNKAKSTAKPIVKSPEEEEILNEENLFQSRRFRPRERGERNTSDLDGTLRSQRGRTMLSAASAVCKVCGNLMTNTDDDPAEETRQDSGVPLASSFDPQRSDRFRDKADSEIDHWFDSSSVSSSSQTALPETVDPSTPTDAHTNPLEPSHDADSNIVQRRSPTSVRTPASKLRRSSSSRSSPAVGKKASD